MSLFNKNRKKSILEHISLFTAKSPEKTVLAAILLFNIIFFLVAACIISKLAPSNLANSGFWPSVFYTITMILDAGCISYVVEDVGKTGVALIIVCLLIVLMGMITFTGAVIGYITNYISQFIENSNAGKHDLKISDHIVILNWNSRAAEIINDLLYSKHHENVIVLVSEEKERIQAEIHDRLADTIMTYNHELYAKVRKKKMGVWYKYLYVKTHKLRNKVTVIVREGDILSGVQLSNISVNKAKTIVILGRDYQNSYFKYSADQKSKHRRGNSNLIKTLMLVADMTSKNSSSDHQKIIVEVEDGWTQSLVDKIIANKERLDKCNIIPMPVNRFLGKLISQLAINPELNQIYSELFSTKGFFFSSEIWNNSLDEEEIHKLFSKYMMSHSQALPLSVKVCREGPMCYYLCDSVDSIYTADIKTVKEAPKIKLNKDYYMNKKNVIILGHNSSMKYVMEGFDAFYGEWNYSDDRKILDMVIVDNEESLKKRDYYKKYPYVSNVVPADIFDKSIIYKTILDFYDKHTGDISILILSDDQVPNVEVDEQSLTYLIYIDDLLQKQKKKQTFNHHSEACDIIVEILNPQNYDAVRSYNNNHVVVSNQYISHMMAQIGKYVSINEFYRDILTYDSNPGILTKELYVKRAGDFLSEIPKKCTAHDLVRGIFDASPDDNKSILMGYIPENEDYILFAGDNGSMEIELKENDKFILCSNH